MSLEVVVSDVAGTRTFDERNLPLHIGTGRDADVRIPGAVASGEIAQIGVLDGRAFVQVPRQGSVTVNGEPVASTRWLEEGDALRVAGVVIDCAISSNQLLIKVADQDIEYETAPPVLPDAADSTTESITPVRSRSRASTQTSPSGSPRKGWYPVYVGLGILLSAALYMFTAITVVVGTKEGEPEVSLPGSMLTPGWDGRYLLWVGTYDVEIKAPGYFPFNGAIDVVSGDRQEFYFELRELPGRVVVETVPLGVSAEVWIDGNPLRVLSAEELSAQKFRAQEFSLDRGNYELRIRAERYLDYVAMLEVEGRDQLQTVRAALVPGWADVLVTTDPAGAEVLSGDEVLGVTPGTMELMAGTRQIVIRKSGFRTEQRTLSVVAGQQEILPLIELEEAGGLISLTSIPSGSAVTLNGIFAGNTPVELEVAKGQSHRIQLSRVGYKTTTRNVDVPDGAPVTVEVALQPRLGTIRMIARPADAELYVDGRPQGEATQDIELLAIPHRLEVRKPGYETWVRQVTPKPGLPQSFDVRLLTPEQAKIAAIPKTLNTSLGQTLQLIEPGEFVMGAPRREQGRRPNEVRRPVRLVRWFYMSREEVSNKEFRAFRRTHTSGAQKYRELAFDSSPAVMVSWDDAAAFCNWLSDREGLTPAYERDGKSWVLSEPVGEGYRLPTEAEWVWVARFDAGQGERKYPWGKGMPPPNAAGNYADMAAEDVASSTIAGYNDGFPVTSPGGAFPANPNGIYDLGGNVAEWVNDRYSVARNSAETLIDPTGPTEGQYHGIRGSSWRHSRISPLRLAYRDFGDQGRLDVGFRIARYAKPAMK